MCWSAEVSLNTFLFALISSAIARSHGASARHLIFLMVFSSMQFAEFLIWRNLENPQANAAASQLAALILVLQPVAAINTIADPARRSAWYVAYAAFLVYARVMATQIDWKTTVAPNGHLQWNWMPRDAATHVIWIAFLLGSLWAAGSYEDAAFACITLLVSLYYYMKDGTYGTIWCSLATAAWIFILARIALK